MARSLSRKGLVRKLDKIFASYIKARDRKRSNVCPFCRKATIEVCFHYISRYFRATRWHEDNAVGSCAGCNLRMEIDPYPFIRQFQSTRGMKLWDVLQKTAHSLVKHDDNDLKRMCDYFQTKLQAL